MRNLTGRLEAANAAANGYRAKRDAEIHRLRAAGMSLTGIAKAYRLTRQRVQQILKAKVQPSRRKRGV